MTDDQKIERVHKRTRRALSSKVFSLDKITTRGEASAVSTILDCVEPIIAERDRLQAAYQKRVNHLPDEADARHQAGAAFWRPWQQRFKELRQAGYTLTNARQKVGGEMAEEGAWSRRTGYDTPSEPTLQKWLKD